MLTTLISEMVDGSMLIPFLSERDGIESGEKTPRRFSMIIRIRTVFLFEDPLNHHAMFGTLISKLVNAILFRVARFFLDSIESEKKNYPGLY